MSVMTATPRERRHFEAIARVKDVERAERQREALARHPVECMREGLALGAFPVDSEIEVALERRGLAQAELARRGRALREA
jgi:hypothetical protein